jgi:hypothetical protein
VSGAPCRTSSARATRSRPASKVDFPADAPSLDRQAGPDASAASPLHARLRPRPHLQLGRLRRGDGAAAVRRAAARPPRGRLQRGRGGAAEARSRNLYRRFGLPPRTGWSFRRAGWRDRADALWRSRPGGSSGSPTASRSPASQRPGPRPIPAWSGTRRGRRRHGGGPAGGQEPAPPGPGLRRRPKDARLVIVGEGPERERIEAEARRLGVADRLVLPGFMADPAAGSAISTSSPCLRTASNSRSRWSRRWRPACRASRPTSATSRRCMVPERIGRFARSGRGGAAAALARFRPIRTCAARSAEPIGELARPSL